MKSKKLTEIGWEEWISLPELNLPAIRAKVDTGARTSALHAFMVEKFVEDEVEKIRFGIHPVPERPEIEVYSVAQLIDEREVTSSNGKSEIRYVIRTMAQFGKEKWPIEITLTNRETMNYRMLLGRSAMQGRVIVIPEQSFLLGSLSVELYEQIQTQKHGRTFRICLLSKDPSNYTTSRIAAAAEARGHEVDIIDPTKCYASLGIEEPSVHFNDKTLSQYDVIIPRIKQDITTYGLAILRQFELLGTYCLNSSESIAKARDKLFAYQLLSRGHVQMPKAAFCYEPTSADDLIKLINGTPFVLKSLQSLSNNNEIFVKTEEAAETAVQLLKNFKTHFLLQSYIANMPYQHVKCIVLGNKVIATIEIFSKIGMQSHSVTKKNKKRLVKLTAVERKMVLRATRLLGLSFASIEMLRVEPQSLLLDINPSPSLKRIEFLSKLDIAEALVEYLEHHARPNMYTLT